MIHFFFKESIADDPASVRAHPHERSFDHLVRRVFFKNTTNYIVIVKFDPGIGADPNPLTLAGGEHKFVDITGGPGIYPCYITVTTDTCPLCHGHVPLTLVPRPVNGQAATAAYVRAPVSGASGDASFLQAAQSDGDPIIIIET